MSEVEKTEGRMGTLKAYGALGLAAFGGLYLLAAAGITGTLVLGVLGVAGTAAYGAYTGEGPIEKVKSVFSKIGGFFSEALSVAKSGFGSAKEWAHTQEVARTAETGTAPVATKESAPDFAKAANANAPEVAKAPKLAPAPAPARKLGA